MIDNANIAPAEKALLALAEKSLFGTECTLTEEEQLAALDESRKQALYCLAAQSVSLTGKNASSVMAKTYSGIKNNICVFSDHTMLHTIMTQAGIPYVILKGAASAYYYPQPQLRMMGDVDFLVSKNDVDRAAKALTDAGFVRDSECDHHIVFLKANHDFELHFTVNGVPEGPTGNTVREYISDIISSASEVKTDICNFENPSPFHHGLVMLLHVQHHMVCGGFGLRQLCDWAMLVNGFSNEQFKEIFEQRLRKIGMWDFAVTLSLVGHIAFGVPYREFMGNDNELAEELLADILSSGNHGRKDSERSNEGLFISNGNNSVNKSRIAQFINSVNKIVYVNWPIARKIKILLPFGWLFFGIRRGIRQLLGKRKPLNVVQSYNNSKKRKDLYKRLHIFEIK